MLIPQAEKRIEEEKQNQDKAEGILTELIMQDLALAGMMSFASTDNKSPATTWLTFFQVFCRFYIDITKAIGLLGLADEEELTYTEKGRILENALIKLVSNSYLISTSGFPGMLTMMVEHTLDVVGTAGIEVDRMEINKLLANLQYETEKLRKAYVENKSIEKIKEELATIEPRAIKDLGRLLSACINAGNIFQETKETKDHNENISGGQREGEKRQDESD